MEPVFLKQDSLQTNINNKYNNTILEASNLLQLSNNNSCKRNYKENKEKRIFIIEKNFTQRRKYIESLNIIEKKVQIKEQNSNMINSSILETKSNDITSTANSNDYNTNSNSNSIENDNLNYSHFSLNKSKKEPLCSLYKPDKKLLRKLKNRISAKKSRDNFKQSLWTLEIKNKDLIQENLVLKNQISKLECLNSNCLSNSINNMVCENTHNSQFSCEIVNSRYNKDRCFSSNSTNNQTNSNINRRSENGNTNNYCFLKCKYCGKVNEINNVNSSNHNNNRVINYNNKNNNSASSIEELNDNTDYSTHREDKTSSDFNLSHLNTNMNNASSIINNDFINHYNYDDYNNCNNNILNRQESNNTQQRMLNSFCYDNNYTNTNEANIFENYSEINSSYFNNFSITSGNNNRLSIGSKIGLFLGALCIIALISNSMIYSNNDNNLEFNTYNNNYGKRKLFAIGNNSINTGFTSNNSYILMQREGYLNDHDYYKHNYYNNMTDYDNSYYIDDSQNNNNSNLPDIAKSRDLSNLKNIDVLKLHNADSISDISNVNDINNKKEMNLVKQNIKESKDARNINNKNRERKEEKSYNNNTNNKANSKTNTNANTSNNSIMHKYLTNYRDDFVDKISKDYNDNNSKNSNNNYFTCKNINNDYEEKKYELIEYNNNINNNINEKISYTRDNSISLRKNNDEDNNKTSNSVVPFYSAPESKDYSYLALKQAFLENTNSILIPNYAVTNDNFNSNLFKIEAYYDSLINNNNTYNNEHFLNSSKEDDCFFIHMIIPSFMFKLNNNNGQYFNSSNESYYEIGCKIFEFRKIS